MNQKKITQLFEIFKAQNPHPTTELNYQNVFELLIAVILSAQATDVAVNKATSKLFAVANTPATIAKLGIRGLIPYIKNIGLYNSKAKHIIHTCELLLKKHAGQVPDNRTALQHLPGVGRKTANVILNTAFAQPTIAVDTHIFRVANRTGLAPGKDVMAVEQALMRVVPKRFQQQAHHWLILHGRYTCMARKPKCHVCGIFSICEWTEKTTAL